jgi:dTDP-4-amino-4,6-dideoxygalactose transaminase
MNAKMSEVHAAMGMAVLPYMERIVAERKAIIARYEGYLQEHFERPRPKAEVGYNYSYYPVLARDAAQRVSLERALTEQGIHPRRYFYPSLDELPYVTGNACPHSRSASERVLCLPLYNGLALEDVDRIAGVVRIVVQN